MTASRPPVALVDYLRLATGYLEKAGSETARLDAEVLLGDVLAMDRMSLYVNFDRPLNPEEVTKYRESLRRRGQGEPVAYITGRRDFRTMTLAVSPAVLIPRPETELLVEAVLDQMSDTGAPLQIADVGTGSGAIVIALALALPAATFLAVDISPEALAVARQNAETYEVVERIRFLEGDLLTPLLEPSMEKKFRGTLDVVVSNPPYVTSDEWATLAKDVRGYEPRIALDGGPDGLALYRRLVPAAGEGLRVGGLLALEIGADQGPAVVTLLRSEGRWESIDVLSDYAGRDRIVVATKGS